MKTKQPIALAVANELDFRNARISTALNTVPHATFLMPIKHQEGNLITKLWSLLKTFRLV